MDFRIPIPSVDPEELEARAQARHAAHKELCSTGGRFIGTSLGAWLSHVQAAGIPHVPANRLAVVPRMAIVRFEEPQAGDAELFEQLRRDLAVLPEGSMARWDHCSSLALKAAMADGRAPSAEEATSLEPGDPRAWELTYEFPGDDVVVWARPWVEAKVMDAFPVEFRVFVQDSRVIGVASYYPQRALPESSEILELASRAKGMAEQLVDQLRASGALPWMPSFGDRFAHDKVHATIDFLVTKTGELLFLEAGPPYGAGAHPCAFIDHPIEGVALALGPGATLR